MLNIYPYFLPVNKFPFLSFESHVMAIISHSSYSCIDKSIKFREGDSLLARILTSIGPAYLSIDLPSLTKVSIQTTSHLPSSSFSLPPSHHTTLLLLPLLLHLTKPLPIHITLSTTPLLRLVLLLLSAQLRLLNADALRAQRRVLNLLRRDARALHHPEAERPHLLAAVLGELDVCAGVDCLEGDAHSGGRGVGGGIGRVERGGVERGGVSLGKG